MKHLIEAVCTGTARPFNGAELSAFAKRPREGAVQIHAEGLAPDEQADRRVQTRHLRPAAGRRGRRCRRCRRRRHRDQPQG